MTDKEKLLRIKKLADEMYRAAQYLTTDASHLHKAMDKYHQFIVHDYHKEEPVSEDLEGAAQEYVTKEGYLAGLHYNSMVRSFKAGAQWQKNHLWRDAQGDDLPEIDREVIVLIKYDAQLNIHDEEYPTYRVGFGHRPNPNGWDGKNIETNEVTHYTPKLYDKGGWNAPNIVYWLNVELPKEIEL